MRLSAVVALSALTRHQVGPRVTPFGSLKMHPPRGWLLRGEGHEGPARCWWHARVRGVGGCPSQPLFPPPPPLRRAAPHRARVCACAAASGRGLRTPVVRSSKGGEHGERVRTARRGRSTRRRAPSHPPSSPARGPSRSGAPAGGREPPFFIVGFFPRERCVRTTAAPQARQPTDPPLPEDECDIVDSEPEQRTRAAPSPARPPARNAKLPS